MPKYRKKPEPQPAIINALKVTEDNLEEVIKFMDPSGKATGRRIDGTSRYEVVVPDGPFAGHRNCAIGRYLLNTGTEMLSVHADHFEKEYELVPEGGHV